LKDFIHRLNSKWIVLLFVILAGGLLLRLYGINFGLPFLYDPDEPFYVSRVVDMLRNLDLNPHWFDHPGSTTLYSLLVIYLGLFSMGRLIGDFPNREAFIAHYYADPTLLYLSGRLLTLAFSMACIVLAYLIARRIFNRKAGLLAAGLVALSPVLVEYAKYIRSDVPTAFFLLGAFWFCLNILERERWRDYLLAGGMTGLAIASKYPAAFFIPVILLAHFLNRPFLWRRQVKLAVSALGGLAALVFSAPFLFLDYKKAITDILFESRPTHLGSTGSGLGGNLIWYIQHPMVESFTVVGIVFLMVGIFFCLISHKRDQYLMMIFPVLFPILISSLQLRWARWLIPALPFMAILIASGIIRSGDEIRRLSRSRGWAALWLGLAIAITVILMLRADLIQGRKMSGEDTRTLARQWILENIPPGKQLLAEVYAPQLPRDRYEHFVIRDKGVMPLADLAYPHLIYRANFEITQDAGKIENIQDICSAGIDYVILSDFYERYLAEKERYPEFVRAYQEIFQLGPTVYEISPTPGINRGPRLRVIKVENCP
jgi:4-amino-4-deoxy-L-arabinose transferase-like glycosyltransferase